MSEDEITTTVTYWPEGVDEVELRTVVFGEDPLIIVEPGEDGVGIEVSLSKIDHERAGIILGVVADALQEHYGEPQEEDNAQ